MSPPAAATARRSSAHRAVPAALPRETRRPDHLRVVGPAERSRRRISPVLGVALTSLLFVGLFALAGAHTVLVQGQLRLDRLDAELAAERARYQQLRLQVAERESPHRVVAVAQERLGMVPPAELVYLSPSSPAPPGGARRTDTPGPSGGAPVQAAGDDTWTVVKPLLEAAAP
jgi:cell division protein FtsB